VRCADLQLFLSAAEAGWPLFYIPDRLAHWSQHSGQSGALRGSDHGLGVADDVLAFWDGWLEGRSPRYMVLTEGQRARWQVRRARALLLSGRAFQARAALRAVKESDVPVIPGQWQLSVASHLPTPVVHAAIRAKRFVTDRARSSGAAAL
jgi:hypothetical protein